MKNVFYALAILSLMIMQALLLLKSNVDLTLGGMILWLTVSVELVAVIAAVDHE